MNLNQLTDGVAEQTGRTKAVTDMILRTALARISQAFVEGDDVEFRGFGRFTVEKRAARVGRNPQTGEPVEIEASRRPKFKPAKALRDAMNSGSGD